MSNIQQLMGDYLKHTTSTSVLYTELLREISFHLQAWNDQIIDSDDLANAVEEIIDEHLTKNLQQ
jgi:hypothetical protein